MGPQRIVCLTAETVDTIYRLGQQQRIVGITGFATHPPQARREKPRIGAYTNARLEQIIALKPDLVLAYSDLQADLVAALIRAGLEVYTFNQRDIAGILQMIARLGALLECAERAQALIAELEDGLNQARAAVPKRRPRVYFEEWAEPMISAIRWVSELIEIAGGQDVFSKVSHAAAATGRFVQPEQVVAAQPELIIGSWCGRRFRPEQLDQRPGWRELPALRHGQVFEIKSADILQPGPTALSLGLRQLQRLIHNAADVYEARHDQSRLATRMNQP